MLIDGLTALRDERGMGVVIAAHSEIKRFDSPDTEPYDRYQPKLHKGASAIVQEAMDAFCSPTTALARLRLTAVLIRRCARCWFRRTPDLHQ
jgi:hypothetical protein